MNASISHLQHKQSVTFLGYNYMNKLEIRTGTIFFVKNGRYYIMEGGEGHPGAAITMEMVVQIYL